ncbi:hypothetical protein GCM10009593_29410 [Microlunatus antarcticus]
MATVEVVVAVDDAFEVTAAPAGSSPVAVAVLTTAPLFTSAWVITYGAVVAHVVLAPGASVVTGQVVVPTFASAIATPVTVRAPVLVTAKEYPTRSPASTRPFVLTSVGVPAVLTRASVVTVDVGVDVLAGLEVRRTLFGSRPLTVAVLATAPASTSAWVIT